jgi:hypothetical protein
VAVQVQGIDGTGWVVRRRWLPRLGDETLWSRFTGRVRSVSRRARDGADPTPDVFDFDDGILVGIAIVVFVLVAVFLIVPLLVALVDLVLLLALGLLGVAARVVLRRPWTVEARSSAGTTLRWQVVGWRASGRHARHVVDELAAGRVPPPDGAPAGTLV